MSGFTSISLILSGAFSNSEIIAEFGLLPPAFLPLGVGRLYDIQVQALRDSIQDAEPLYLTVPESFEVPAHDRRCLANKGVSLLSVPDGLSLGESLVYAINVVNAYAGGVRLLYGDTQIGTIPSGFDVVAGHIEGDDYSWAAINHKNDEIVSLETIEAANEMDLDRPVACGYFAFSSGAEIVRMVSQARGDFIKGLNLYNRHLPLTLSWVDEWYDFGHLQTYFRSRRVVTTARVFNNLQITHNTVCKRSADTFKMSAEAEWFENVPPSVQPYTARLLEKHVDGPSASYTTEYQYAPNLAEIYVFGQIGRATWKKILASSIEFLEICTKTVGEAPREKYSRELMGKKSFGRLEQFARESGFDIERELTYKNRPTPSLLSIAYELERLIPISHEEPCTLIHGDFCFSNILYNSRNDRISVIDPRGYVFSGEREIYGDFRYDLAKYSHSVDGLYDFILAGRYDLTQRNAYDFELNFDVSPQRQWLQDSFADVTIAGASASGTDIRAIMISLFISMLPLHADRPDRQKAFIANALRLFTQMKG
ncbi:capsular biosynthesis protein [Asaia sp. BMEF1]|uniref:capsular biosynthesis protein n=1 Tax=Asaia sp. BMEF1 TaxID=3155932 RepID=UPI003F67734E